MDPGQKRAGKRPPISDAPSFTTATILTMDGGHRGLGPQDALSLGRACLNGCGNGGLLDGKRGRVTQGVKERP